MTENKKKYTLVARLSIVIALAIVVGVAMIAKNDSKSVVETDSLDSTTETVSAPEETRELAGDTVAADKFADSSSEALPKLVDLGAKSCIPCKMMAPILDSLKVEYKDRFETVFIDVWENRSAGTEYGIRMIPTQIFFDAAGKELFRHEGFYSKEDILGKWKELGIEIEKRG